MIDHFHYWFEVGLSVAALLSTIGIGFGAGYFIVQFSKAEKYGK